MDFWTFLAVAVLCISLVASKTCNSLDSFIHWDPKKCSTFEYFLDTRRPVYIIYDVNPFEGFNLRRDVYIRWAVFTNHLQRIQMFNDIRLVLPPYPRLYHWKNSAFNQDNLPWDLFFDLPSLKKFAPILDYHEFLEEVKVFSAPSERQTVHIDKTFQLQHFEDMFENGVFIDKFEYHNCSRAQVSPGDFLQQTNIHSKQFVCLKFQGSASLLTNVLKKEMRHFEDPWPKVFLFLSGEIVLHDNWGNQEFWRARRSMRFSNDLMAIAKDYRLSKLNSTDFNENIHRPIDWRQEKERRDAIGGDYLCAHLRRGDFVFGREKTIPSMKSAANQIKQVLNELKLKKVFIASDCSPFDFKNFKSYLPREKVFRFQVTDFHQRDSIKDGGIAIIDQIICSRARHFIGTYESTFTYRIYEEREILGFSKSSTFNTFCKNEDESNCVKNAIWPIVF